MPRTTLIGRHLKSLDDVKTAGMQLRRALEDAGVTVAPNKVLEVVALLCGATSHDELQRSLKGTPSLGRIAPRADVRLLTLPEVLTQSNSVGDGPLVVQLQFWQKDSAPDWCYTVSVAAIEPSALEAARRLVLGLPLRPADAKWATGSLSKASVINSKGAASPLTVDTMSLAGAAYLGDGQWSVGSKHYCRVSVDNTLLIERRPVSVPLKVMAHEAKAAVAFVPPPEFAAAGFEVSTVNIETQLMLRCLKLRNGGRVLESLRLVEQRLPFDRSNPATAPRALRAALFRADENGDRVQVVTVYDHKESELTGLRWAGTRWDGSGSPTATRGPDGSELTGSRIQDSGEDGLARIWQEVRTWISWCDSSAPAHSFPTFLEEAAEAKVSMSQIRRADMEKWVADTRDWEHPPDESQRKLPGSMP